MPPQAASCIMSLVRSLTAPLFYVTYPSMKPQFFAAIHQICDEKNIPYERVIETIKAALATAYRKDFGNKEQEIEIVMQDDSDIATVLLVKEVVEDVENSNIEISLAEAQKMKKDVEVGDIIKIDVTPMEYGRIAAQSAKQVILQRLQEAERDALYDMFKNRENEIMTAQVMRIENGNVNIQIEKHNVVLGHRDQLPNEKYYTGKRIKVYLDKVVHTSKGPQLSISRTHPNLVVRLLEMEIPEIAEGQVEVRSIARDAGTRSKVAVWSEDSKLDPVGACIGQKGVRIQAVMNELNGERVDIIEWTQDPKEFIATALQPAKIAEVIIVNAGEDPRVPKRAAVFVEESERPMAIGKQGQNVRLASDLTGYELDLYNLDQLPAFQEKLKELMKSSHGSLTGRRIDDKDLLSPDAEKALEEAEKSLKQEEGESSDAGEWGALSKPIVTKLEAAGYHGLEDLKDLDLAGLEGIEGIGKASAKKIFEALS